MNQLELPIGFTNVRTLRTKKKVKHDPWMLTKLSIQFPGIKFYFCNIRQMTFVSTDYKKLKPDPWMLTKLSIQFPGIKFYFCNIRQMTFASTDYKKLYDLCVDCRVDPIRIWFEREWSQVLVFGADYVL